MTIIEQLAEALREMLYEWDKFTRYGSPIAKASNENVACARSALAAYEASKAAMGAGSVCAPSPEDDAQLSGMGTGNEECRKLERERDEARRALRELPCPRPANCDPDDTTIGQCYDKGNCGCIYGRRGLSAGG